MKTVDASSRTKAITINGNSSANTITSGSAARKHRGAFRVYDIKTTPLLKTYKKLKKLLCFIPASTLPFFAEATRVWYDAPQA